MFRRSWIQIGPYSDKVFQRDADELSAFPRIHLRMKTVPDSETCSVENTKWWIKSRNSIILSILYHVAKKFQCDGHFGTEVHFFLSFYCLSRTIYHPISGPYSCVITHALTHMWWDWQSALYHDLILKGRCAFAVYMDESTDEGTKAVRYVEWQLSSVWLTACRVWGARYWIR